MTEELLVSLLFALERFFRDVLDRSLERMKDKKRSEELKKAVHQFRFGQTDEERDDAAIRVEEKFEQRSK